MLVCVVLSCLFLVALWSPAWERLISWLSCLLCFATFPNQSWFTSEIRVRLAPWNWFKPSSKIFYWPFQGGISFVDDLCYICLVFVMLLHLFIAALWLPEWKGLTSWLLFVIFIMILLLSHLVSWDRCGTWLYQFLILAVFLTLVSLGSFSILSSSGFII